MKTKIERLIGLIREALEMHREIKHDILKLMGEANKPNMTKHKMTEELFKIFLKFK